MKDKRKTKPMAYEAYEKLADHYAARVDTKPHNAYYDRPAMLSLLPDVSGRQVLDVGCGPGAYTEELIDRGATVTGVDMSPRMLELARRRVGDDIKLVEADINQPLKMFDDEEFEVINAPLCLEYILDWLALFKEFHRILKPNGVFLFSCGHPSFDAEYFKTGRYFMIEPVECVWRGFGLDVSMPSYRRSIEEVLMPVINANLTIERILEPLPTEKFKKVDPIRYAKLMRRPNFICVRARKKS